MDTHTHKLIKLLISLIKATIYRSRYIFFKIKTFYSEKKKPTIIIANTIKGKGISFMENSPQWHSKVLEKKDYLLAKRELV